MARTVLLSLAAWAALAGPAAAQQTREQKLQADRKKVEAEGFWIYNDLPAALAEARKAGKPLFVVLRCVPCEECVKLDDDLVNQDKRVRPLLEKYVCVRLVSTNGLDLGLFQFDYDQSFAAFLLEADGTVLGRFGTRSHRTAWADDVSVEGLAKALQGGLDLHRGYPQNKAALAAKRGPAPEFPSPEKYPLLRDKYGPTLGPEGKVVPSCIHCHQIGDAQRALIRARKEAIPEQMLFPYPHPKVVGLVLDPRERATVLRVEAGSPAARAGLRAGDALVRLGGQPLLSLADVQWVLHRTPAGAADVALEVRRGDETTTLTLGLPDGWRRRDDLSWRASSWPLRRMALGGMALEELPAEARREAGLGAAAMALRVRHVGQFGPHAAAKQAGFLVGDVLVGYDGRTDLRRESDLLAYGVMKRLPGERVAVAVLRGGKTMEIVLPMQE